MTVQYIESNKYFKLDFIGIDNTAHVRYSVAVCGSIFLEIVMSIHEDDYESGFPRVDKMEDLDATYWYSDELISSLGLS